MAKRTNGEGTWGKKTINGIEYVRYRKKYEGVGFKDFYGKKKKEVQDKVNAYEKGYKQIKTNLRQPKVLSELISEWMYEVKFKSKTNPLSRRTMDTDEGVFNTRIKGTCIENIQLGQLNQGVCEKYIDELIEKKYSKASIDRVLILIKQYLKYASNNNEVDESIIKHLASPSEKVVQTKKREISVLSAEDMEKLYNEAKRVSEQGFSFGTPIGELVYRNNGYAIIFIMYTGLRISEFLELRWKDFNLDEGYINIERTVSRVFKLDDRTQKENIIKEPKTLKGRRLIPLCDRALECVEYFNSINPSHSPEDLFATTTIGTRMSKDNLLRSLKTMLVRGKCSVTDCGLHSLRHSFGSYLLVDEGVDIAVVSALLGHAKVSTTYDIYIHVLDRQKLKAIQIFNKVKDKGEE